MSRRDGDWRLGIAARIVASCVFVIAPRYDTRIEPALDHRADWHAHIRGGSNHRDVNDQERRGRVSVTSVTKPAPERGAGSILTKYEDRFC